MALVLSRREDAATLTISAVGDLDMSTAEDFEHEIASVAGGGADGETAGTTDIVIDLSGVGFIDSAGINALLTARRTADERACTFRVQHANGLVRQVLEMTGVWEHLSQHPVP